MKKFKILGIMLVLSCFTGFTISAMEEEQGVNKEFMNVNKGEEGTIEKEKEKGIKGQFTKNKGNEVTENVNKLSEKESCNFFDELIREIDDAKLVIMRYIGYYERFYSFRIEKLKKKIEEIKKIKENKKKIKEIKDLLEDEMWEKEGMLGKLSEFGKKITEDIDDYIREMDKKRGKFYGKKLLGYRKKIIEKEKNDFLKGIIDKTDEHCKESDKELAQYLKDKKEHFYNNKIKAKKPMLINYIEEYVDIMKYPYLIHISRNGKYAEEAIKRIEEIEKFEKETIEYANNCFNEMAKEALEKGEEELTKNEVKTYVHNSLNNIEKIFEIISSSLEIYDLKQKNEWNQFINKSKNLKNEEKFIEDKEVDFVREKIIYEINTKTKRMAEYMRKKTEIMEYKFNKKDLLKVEIFNTVIKEEIKKYYNGVKDRVEGEQLDKLDSKEKEEFYINIKQDIEKFFDDIHNKVVKHYEEILGSQPEKAMGEGIKGIEEEQNKIEFDFHEGYGEGKAKQKIKGNFLKHKRKNV